MTILSVAALSVFVLNSSRDWLFWCYHTGRRFVHPPM